MISIQAGRVIASKYRLERPLAKGGMGSVWIARHVQLDLVVAIKFMEASQAFQEARVRFDREAKTSAKLKSPHIVHVYDYGVEDGRPYLAMELLSGEDLESKLKREGRLSPAVTSAILWQLCKGLRVAHDAGLIHRDLKPGNIFLTRGHEGENLAKILDFGIVKAVGPSLPWDATQVGTIIGSPRYMSPEQVRSAKGVDHRSDLWSMGVLLFQCVTGRMPFESIELAVLIRQICVEPIPAPSTLAPNLGPEMDRFFARALARDPDRRFQTARELAEAFAAVAGRRPRSATGTGNRAPSSRSPVSSRVQGPAGGASAQSSSIPISEMPTTARGGPSGAAPGSSDGTLSPATQSARTPTSAGGGLSALMIALAVIFGVLGVAGVALFRKGRDEPSKALTSGAEPAGALMTTTGAQPFTAPAPTSSTQPGINAKDAPRATASPSASTAPTATPPASSQPSAAGSDRPSSSPKSKSRTSAPSGRPQDLDLGF